MNPSISTRDAGRAEHTAALVDTLYSLTIDSADFDEFMQSWGAVSDAWAADLNANPGARSGREQQALLQHFQRAEQIFLRIGRHQEGQEDLQTLVTSKSHPAVLVDAAGRIVALNPALQHLAATAIVGRNLYDLLAELTDSNTPTDSPADDNLIGQPASRLILIDDEPCLLVSTPLPDGQHTLVDFSRASWHDDLETDLRAMFGLSRSEVAICHLLYEGYEVKAIAELRHRAEDTVRKQIKSIHGKTRCARQVDFMRLLTGMLVMGQIGRDDPRLDSRLVNSDSVQLADGRQLFYFHLMPAGIPQHTVVIVHGIASSPILPTEFFDSLQSNGVAIVGVSRAGYSRSSPLPTGASPVDQFARDLSELLDHLQLPHVSLVSIQSGALFSFAAANTLGSRISRMVCIAPILPLATAEQIAALPTGLKVLARTKKLFPAFFPLVIQAVINRVDAREVDALYRNWYKGVPCDLAVLDNPDSQLVLESWLRFCGAQGAEPYITDAGFVLSDWSALMQTTTTPTLIVHGDGDQTVPASIVHRCVADHAQIQVKSVPATGQLMILAQPHAIARHVLAYLQDPAFTPSGE